MYQSVSFNEIHRKLACFRIGVENRPCSQHLSGTFRSAGTRWIYNERAMQDDSGACRVSLLSRTQHMIGNVVNLFTSPLHVFTL
jgi:hypothetical protein